MRTIKELLQLMLDNKVLFKTGLCFWLVSLKANELITDKEYDLLNEYIENNKPKYSIFNIYMLINDSRFYYWKAECITPRIKWLKHHININK